jgi:hypothetical protein
MVPIAPRRGGGILRRFPSNFSGDADAADTEKSLTDRSKSVVSCPGTAAAIAAAEAGARGGCCCCVACSACCWACGVLPDCILYYCGLMPWAGMTGCATIPKSKYPRESAGLQSASDGVRDARESSRFMFNADCCQRATRGRIVFFLRCDKLRCKSLKPILCEYVTGIK